MFEMTYSTADGRRVRGGMAFDGHARNGVYVTPNGSAITRKDWSKMKRALTFDELASPNISPGEKSPGEKKSAPNWDAQAKMADLRTALHRYCGAAGVRDPERGGGEASPGEAPSKPRGGGQARRRRAGEARDDGGGGHDSAGDGREISGGSIGGAGNRRRR